MNTSISDISKKINLGELSVNELLLTHAAVLEELRNRKILRTSNNPAADYTEWLVSKVLGMHLQGNSSTGFDALDSEGKKVEIKCRRVTSHNKSVQLSSFRNLINRSFDYLIGVVYKEDFTIDYVALVPYDIVLERSQYREHTNSHILLLRKNIFEDERVVDLTNKFTDSSK